MAIALDTTVLVAAEKFGDLAPFLPDDPEGVYIPALAAAEFLVGTHPPVKDSLRERARRIYENQMRDLVVSFEEADAAQLAALNAENRRRGQTMGFYDAAIAAPVMAHGDKLLALDSDYDRLKDRLELLKP